MPVSNATTDVLTLRQALLVATALTKAKGQPRVPAGSPKGGQFAPKGGGAGGAPSQGSMFDLDAWAPATKPVVGNPAGMHGISGGGDPWSGAGWKPKGADAKPKKPVVVPPGWEDAPDYLVPKKPTKPSPVEDNANPEDAAVYVRGNASGDGINGLGFSPWSPPQDWNGVEGQRPDIDAGLPPLEVPRGKHAGAGVVVFEPDGRVWVVEPTNHFGGYKHTYPKGTVEPEIRSLQVNAIKEAWEESGLKVEITGHIGDYERTTSVARFYSAKRVGGDPADHGFESQSVKLVPQEDAYDFLNNAVDRAIMADALAAQVKKARAIAKALLRAGWPADLLVEKGKKGGALSQPRWPAGTTWGGRWKPSASAGGAAALVEAGKEFQPALATGKNPDNSALKAANKKIAVYAEKANAGDVGFFADIEASGKAPKTEGKLNPYQVALAANFEEAKGFAQAKAGVAAKPKAAGGTDGGNDAPVKLSTMTKVAAKPGGSADGAIYQDANGQKWLVKGYKNSDQARSEVPASKLYAAAGVAAPDMKLVDLEGKHGNGEIGVMSRWEDGLGKFDQGNAAHLEGARGNFAAAAWLRDWDAVGMGFDNVALRADGTVVQIDPGGSLEFRAQGDLKPGGLPTKVDEWNTLRDAKTNAQAAAVYGGMTTTDLIASSKKVTNVDDATIKAMVDKYGPGSATKKAAMAAALMARRDDIVLKVAALEAKVAKPKAKAQPAPADTAPAAAAAAAAADVTPPTAAALNPDGIPKPLTYDAFPKADTAGFYENKVAAAHMALNAGDMDGFNAIAGYAPKTKKGLNSPNYKAFQAHMAEVKAAAGGKATDAPVKGKALSLDEGNAVYASVKAKHGDDWMGPDAAKGDAMLAAADTGDLATLQSIDPGNNAGLADYKAGLFAAMADDATSAAKTPSIPEKTKPLTSDEAANAWYAVDAKLGGGWAAGVAPKAGAMFHSAKLGDAKAVSDFDTGGHAGLDAYKGELLAAMDAQGTKADATPPRAAKPADLPSAAATAAAGFDPAGLDTALAAKPSPASLTTPANPNKKLLDKIADVEAIAQSVKDGKTTPADAIAAIQAQKFGSNTYGKKGQAFADNVVAALGGYTAGAAGDAAKVTAAATKAPDVPAKGVKPKPHFKAENLGAPPDFTNWNGSGKGLSSKAQVNEANTAAAKAAYDVALKGDLAALKAMTFPEISKETGAPTGKMLPYSEHPSQHVAAYHANLVNEIDLMLNPPRMPVLGKVISGKAFDGGSSDIKPVPPGKAVAAVAKSRKAGAYIVLGKVTEPFKVPTPNDSVVASDAWKQKTKDWYATVPKAAKDTIGYYVGAGSGPLNQALQDGTLNTKPNTSSYGFNPKTVAQHIQDFKKALVDVPEGTTFVRNMGNKGYNKKADPITIKKLQDFLLNAEKGTVLQEPAFTSASWTGGNSVLSNNDIQWKFTAGKGVKVSPGWATFNQGEGEALFPPNQRYMIVGAKKVGKTVVVDAVLLPFDDYAA